MKFNTAIAALMALVNDFYGNGASRGDMRALLLMLSPFAPHLCEEQWEVMGFAKDTGKVIAAMSWPVYDESKTVASSVEMAVQVQGKLRATVVVPTDSDEATVLAAVKEIHKISKALEGMEIVKVIHVKNKLVNLILKPAK